MKCKVIVLQIGLFFWFVVKFTHIPTTAKQDDTTKNITSNRMYQSMQIYILFKVTLYSCVVPRSPNHTTFHLSIPNFGLFTGLSLATMMSWIWRQMTPYWSRCRPRIFGARATTCALDPEAFFLHSTLSRWQRMNWLKVNLCFSMAFWVFELLYIV